MTGALPTISPNFGTERFYTGSFEFEHLIQSLRELFEQDRRIASQPDSIRCGICYLYFSVSDLHYREEGFYVCEGCQRSLGDQSVFMLRKQQKM